MEPVKAGIVIADGLFPCLIGEDFAPIGSNTKGYAKPNHVIVPNKHR